MISCNLSEEINQHPQYIAIKAVGATILLSLAFIIGIPGNILVMWSIYGKLKNISVTMLLIGNLALADFNILLFLPIWIYTFAVNEWIFGLVFCKFLLYVVYFNLYASIFLITLLSVERFLAVFRPFPLQRWTRRRVFKKITILIWIIAALLGIHSLPFHNSKQSQQPFQCVLHEYNNDTQKLVLLILESCFGFLVPFCIIVICYTNLWRKLREMRFVGRRKSDKIIVIVVATFIICWIPHHIFNIVSITSVFLGSCRLERIVDIGSSISGALVFLNSCLNPLFYFYYAFRMKSPTNILRLKMYFEKIGGTETEQKPSENTENTTDRSHIDDSALVVPKV
ncbi:leukotriene B4 receptor 1-like [Anomaloglossus baeobatrachus]|uniref:leukotriene B4 receptor 1-like n=1 Tax=Anomaloglossus baeobatrachus TaxID=238106 RepID=UPI003F50A89E